MKLVHSLCTCVREKVCFVAPDIIVCLVVTNVISNRAQLFEASLA